MNTIITQGSLLEKYCVDFDDDDNDDNNDPDDKMTPIRGFVGR